MNMFFEDCVVNMGVKGVGVDVEILVAILKKEGRGVGRV